ncbi:hypothetical protein CLV30_105134 [Haloactinopolyspora alba]|uniref:Uncharacterized protein n=1 Tax=Haloactinopolyspora alba TaxID=648780 RepID=A0A2P8E5B7_9ACTN|nr:DUF6350 family protein [Haloactinopolyspora alba]PSL04668.1 hypothetical protein CLV30_105134 [Haloactinopolyspora alba]
MPDLLTRPLLRRDEPAWGSRVPWLAAIAAAGWALVATFAMSVLPAMAIWISEGAGAPMGDPLRFGARVWLAAHRTGQDVAGADFTIAPLGLTIVFVLLMYRSARWAAHSAGVSGRRGTIAVVLPAVLTYALGAGIIAGMGATAEVSAVPLEAVCWAGAWSCAAAVVGVAHEADLLPRWYGRLPLLVRAALAGAAAALAGLIAVGAVLATVSAVANSGQVGALARALDAGVLGGAVLAVGGALIMPNAVIWAMSFALGPGFAVGTGTSVAPGGVELGPVPAVPALGALPADLPGPAIWLVLAGPVLAGVLAGLVSYARLAPGDDGRPALVPVLGTAAGAGVAAAIGAGTLALLSGGTAGAARLTEIGPVPWQTAAATLGFVSVTATVTVLLLRWQGGSAARRAAGASGADDAVTVTAADGSSTPDTTGDGTTGGAAKTVTTGDGASEGSGGGSDDGSGGTTGASGAGPTGTD